MDNDGSYKRIFSEKRMVQDLLTGFIRQDWVGNLDFSSLEQVNTAHISDNFDRRFNDTIWKVNLNDSWVYVCIMLEFQSIPDKFMPLRIMTYLGLFYEHLVRSKTLLKNGKLPPVLPIVLYNGVKPWDCTIEMFHLIENISLDLEKFTPRLTYLLINEADFTDEELSSPGMKSTHNLVAALFALENAEGKRAILNVVGEMLNWLSLPEQQTLSRALAGWFNKVVRPAKNVDKLPAFEDLAEVHTMLRETVQGWYEEAERKGLKNGMKKGIEKGVRQMVTSMHKEGIAIETIAKVAKLSLEEVSKILQDSET